MKTIGMLAKSWGLAMAGKNPWGGSSGGADGEDGPASPDEPATDGSGSGGNSGDNGGKGRGPRNPWLPGNGDEPRRSAKIEDILKNRGPEGPRRGGPRGPSFRLPDRPGGKSWWPVLVATVVLVWVGATSFHQVGPKEQGVVSWLGGKYSRTMTPGINWTLPWPVQSVSIEQVSGFRTYTIPDPEQEPERLMLTGDQNLVDLSYNVRWNIKDLKQFRYQLAEPEETVKEVAEAAMRASVAEQSLDSVLSGAGRAETETRVLLRMQQILDAYRSGIAIQGVQIIKTDPPKKVEDAFKNVSAAQQEAESYINQAQAAAQQVLARAQGDAAAFDKVYAQYKLAPEVTRRRMYYETMERVLSQTDKTVIEAGGVTPYLPLPEVKRRLLPNANETTVTAPGAAEGR